MEKRNVQGTWKDKERIQESHQRNQQNEISHIKRNPINDKKTKQSHAQEQQLIIDYKKRPMSSSTNSRR